MISYRSSNSTAMVAKKFSASMDDRLLDEVGRAAESAGVTLSAWLAQAARDRLGIMGLRQLVTDWEAEHGAFSLAERAAAKRRVDAATTVAPSTRVAAKAGHKTTRSVRSSTGRNRRSA